MFVQIHVPGSKMVPPKGPRFKPKIYIKIFKTLRQYEILQNHLVHWLVGCFGFNGPLRQYFSLYRAVSQREGEREERIDESKNVQTTPTRTYCKRNRPLPYCYQNCRTPRHLKLTQHHRTTRPPPTWFRCMKVGLKHCIVDLV